MPEYFESDRHDYMQVGSGRLAEYVYAIIKQHRFADFDTAIELGAGMGRFSSPVVEHFENVYLVEPSRSYAEHLRSIYDKRNVNVHQSDATTFLDSTLRNRPAIVFCFHLLHHLTAKERGGVYAFIARSGSIGVFVEPNPYNPLILLQILLQPNMNFREEKQYLKLTRGRYELELKEAGLRLSHYRRICFLPPFLLSRLLDSSSPERFRRWEALCNRVPFVPSYQLIVCDSS